GRESRSDTRSRSERSRRFASARIIRPFARGSPIIERMPRPVLRLFLIAIVARTPYAAISLLLIVRTKELTGSYAASGLVVAGLSIAIATTSPWVGRMVDRRGQTAVLRATVAVSTSALVTFALLPHGTPLWALVACAAVAGAATGPLLAVWGLGSMLGGLLAARAGAPADAARWLAILLAALGLGDLALVPVGSPGGLAPILLVAGAAIAPLLGTAYSLVDRVAPKDGQTEAFAWLTTAIGIGLA